MANSKYEYVKSYEVEDEVMHPNLIVVRIDGRNFERFSEVHGFDKPFDEKALDLMNSCATEVLKKYPDIVFAYGFSDEYSFVLKKESEFHQRRSSKILSIIVSFFTSVYVTKWKEFFPQALSFPPSFHSRIVICASVEVLQAYLAWRQGDCHTENQYHTCLWELIKRGKREEAHDILKGTQKREKNELLFQFERNYNDLRDMVRQGSCLLKAKVQKIVKYNNNGTPVQRLQRMFLLVHSKKIAAKSFWNEHPTLRQQVGGFKCDVNKIKPEYVKSFQFESKLMPSTWIVIRVDGCNFHRFSEDHKFVKPNDEQALELMNSCAVAMLKEFGDIVFAYGVSDEYSFVLKKDCQLHERHASILVSIIVSFFTASYVMKWREFFPSKQLEYAPYFDGRAVCYPTSEILRDYIAWRQVDCHINNQYNTCFWSLVKSGMSRSKAQKFLKGTKTEQKNDLLLEFKVDYHKENVMFRQGSSVFWDKEEQAGIDSDGMPAENSCKKLVVEHCNVIESSFWNAHASILEEQMPSCRLNLSAD